MEILAKGFIFVAVLVVLLLVFTFPLMWFINWLFSPALLLLIFGTVKLGFWQTLVLGAVTSALFKTINVSRK